MKIAIVGGGSFLWSFGVVRQLIDDERIDGTRLVLMDIDAEALDLVGKAVEIRNQASGSPLQIERLTELEPALEGADFVLVSISTGGLEAMRHDLEIPEKYGILHTVGDTVGPGGWSRAVRNIPVFDHFGRTMRRVCPDAWLINVSNPLTVLTRVAHRNHGIKCLGMCPGVDGHARMLAKLAGLGADARIDYVVTGVDHGSWFTHLSANGVDVLERLAELGYRRSDGRLPTRVETEDPLAVNAGNCAVFAAWRELGYMPALNDRHQVENWPWFLTREDGIVPLGVKRTSIGTRMEGLRERREALEEYVGSAGQSGLDALGHGDDPIGRVIGALCGHRPFMFGANYRNCGQIPGFPEDAVVETRCHFDHAGVSPLASPMPDILKCLVMPHVFRQEAVIDIALSGSFDQLVALVLTDPLCSRLEIDKCRDMMRELLEANRAHIRNPRLLEFGGGS